MAYGRKSSRRSTGRRTNSRRATASRRYVSGGRRSGGRRSGGGVHTIRLVVAQDHSLAPAGYQPGVPGTVGVANLGPIKKSSF